MYIIYECVLFSLLLVISFFFELYVDHRDLHLLTHSFPTRRSSDLLLDQERDPLAAGHKRVGDIRRQRDIPKTGARDGHRVVGGQRTEDRKSTRLNSSH